MTDQYKNKTYIPDSSVQQRQESINFKNILRSALGQGLAFGFGDEVEAFVKSLSSDKEYEDLAKEIRSELELFKETAPAIAYGSEIAGGLVTGGLGLGRTLATTAARSGLTGAAYGAGTAEGDIAERTKAALVTAPVSAVGGYAAQKYLPKITPEAKKLMEEGVELTPGQALSGTIGTGLRRIEETATSIPALGTKEALERSTETFNKAVYNKVLDKIGYQLPKNIDIEDAPKIFEKTIINKLNQSVKSLQIKNVNDIKTVVDDILLDSPLTKAEIKRINVLLDKMIFSKAKNGKLKGDDLQKADSFLNRQTRNYSTSADAAQREVGDIYSNIYDNFSNYLIKNNPKNLVKNYQQAKNAYGDLIVISKAGTRGAADTIFTPKQLLAQSRAIDPTSAKRKTFIGEGRLQDIGRLGEKVIGREIPESGTIPRFLTTTGALGGLGAIDPLYAGISAATLGAYQSPTTQKLLLQALQNVSAGTQRITPYGVEQIIPE
jgi:hypothetical protein